MPTYRVTGPDGRKFILTGDAPPTEQELEAVFRAQPATSSPKLSAPKPDSTLAAAGKAAVGTVAGAVTEPMKGLKDLASTIVSDPELLRGTALEGIIPGGPMAVAAGKALAGQTVQGLQNAAQPGIEPIERISHLLSAVPVVGPAAQQIGMKLGVGSTYARPTGEAMSPQDKATFGEGVGEMVGNALLAGAGKVAGPATESVRVGGLGKIAEAILSRGNKIPERAFKYGKDPIRGLTTAMKDGMDVPLTRKALKNEVTGRITDLTDELNRVVDQAGAMQKGTAPGYRFKPIVQVQRLVDTIVDDFRKELVPKGTISQIEDVANDIVSRIGAKASLKEVLAGKRLVAKSARYSGADEASRTVNDFRQKVAHRLGEAVETRVPDGKAIELNRKISDLIEAEKLLSKRGAGGSSIFSRVGQHVVGAVAGSAVGGVPGGIAGAAIAPTIAGPLQALIARVLKGRLPADLVAGTASAGALQSQE